MAPLSHKKDCETSKSGFALIDQSVTFNFELSYNERTLGTPYQVSQFSIKISTYKIFLQIPQKG